MAHILDTLTKNQVLAFEAIHQTMTEWNADIVWAHEVHENLAELIGRESLGGILSGMVKANLIVHHTQEEDNDCIMLIEKGRIASEELGY